MRRLIASVVAIATMALAAQAQGVRPKLDLPVNVPFGTSYAQAKKVLGSKAQEGDALAMLGRKSGVKALSVENGYLRADGRTENINLFFTPKDRLASVEVPLVLLVGGEGGQKTLDQCLSSDRGLLPNLLKAYGQPDNRRTEKNPDPSLIATYAFKDGSRIEYRAELQDFGGCALQLRFLSNEAGQLQEF